MDSTQKSEPLVSISCITFNHVNYIEKALNGFLMQKTNFNFEVLIHDDASTDGTEDIIRNFERRCPSIIKPLYEETNQWVKGRKGSAVFNFPRAKGKYIALCEGDDYWTDPLKLQKQVDFLEANEDYNICFHNVELYDETDRKFKEDTITREVSKTTDVLDLARGNYIHTPSVVLRNNFNIPEWFFKSPIGDWPLYMIAIRDKKLKKLDDTMAVYRLSNSGIWSNRSKENRIKSTIKSIKLLINSKEFNSKINSILKLKVNELKNGLPKKVNILVRMLNKIKRFF